MGETPAAVHPAAAVLALFAAGRLSKSQMERLGEHVAECPVCLAVLEEVPENSMVGLLGDLRSQIDESTSELGEVRDRDEGSRPLVAEQDPPKGPGPADPAASFRPVGEPAAGRPPGGSGEHPRYHVRTLLGRGGMGLIYLADDRLEGRQVVLKFLREDLLDHPRLVERFRREAAAAILLKHPNIVDVHGAESFGRWPALVMEYIPGTDLARLVEQAGAVPVRVGCEVIRQAALGLQYSFEQGMVHRDIKPSNLMLGMGGTVKILDFGLAKMQSELSIDAGLTSTGAFLGSVDYMAPEQADDPRLADIRADIYSLGCTFYHLLSGAPPFLGMTFQVLEAHQNVAAAPLDERRPDVPAALADLVGRMMAKEPARRFQTPVEVARALVPFLEAEDLAPASPPPPPARRPLDRPVPPRGAVAGVGFQPVTEAPTPAPRPKARRRWPRALAYVLALVAVVLAVAGAYRLATLKTELVLETDLPNAEVYVEQEGRRVAVLNRRQTERIELEPGRYDVRLPPGMAGLRISRETVTLRRGDRIAVSVRRASSEPDEWTAEYLKLLERKPWWVKVDVIYDNRPGRDRSRSDFDKQMLRDYGSAESRYAIGVQLARHGYMGKALSAFELAIEVQPEYPDALFDLGLLLRTQGQLPEAIAALREAVRAQPDAVDAHMALGLCLAAHAEPEEALSELRAAVALRPQDAEGWYNLGVVLGECGQPAEAIAAFTRAIPLQPEMADAHDRIASVLAGQGRAAEAGASRREASRLRDLAVVHNNQGIDLARDEETEQAIAAFRKAIRVRPGFVEARVNLGAALLGREEMGPAMAALTEAIRLEPGSAAAHVNLGIALQRQGAGQAALAFAEAHRLQPGIDMSRRCWARAAAAVRTEPTGHFPALRGIPPRKPDQ